MAFNKNLIALRKRGKMSQEDLAERLEVSRQAVGRWETGEGYPEMDRLKSIAEIFDATLDELVYQNITEKAEIKPSSRKREYEAVFKAFRRGISLGVGLIILGAAALVYLASWDNERVVGLGVILLLFTVLIAVPIFIITSINHENAVKRIPAVDRKPSELETARINRNFPLEISLGIALILAGVIALVSFYLLDIASFSATWPVAMLLVVVAFAVMIFISSGMNKDRIDEIEEQEKWQKLTPKMRKNIELSGKICGTIMLLATAIYLLMGFAFGGWVVYWFVFPIGGIMCGIVGTILNADIPKALGEK